MNTSTQTPECNKDSVETYKDLTKLIITLSTGTLVLSPAFLGLAKFEAIIYPWFLIFSWTSLFLAIVFGLLTISCLAGTQHMNEYNVDRADTKWFSRFQWIAFGVGIVLFGIFVGLNLTNTNTAKKLPMFLGYVKAETVLVRDKPSIQKDNIIDGIKKSENLVLRIVEEKEGWLNIVYIRGTETEKRGWVFGQCVEISAYDTILKVLDVAKTRKSK